MCVCQTYQHGGSKVKLVEELSDKDVCLHQVVFVSILDIPDDLREPLPLLLGTGHPDEKYLKQLNTTKPPVKLLEKSCIVIIASLRLIIGK